METRAEDIKISDDPVIALYRTIIRAIIEKHAQFLPATGEVEVEIVSDESVDHYELLMNGWDGNYRIEGGLIHIDIRNGKIWIQHDGTEEGVAGEMVEAGIPHDKIVLAFKHPSMRPYTDFAVA
jgi:hypothetical protein